MNVMEEAEQIVREHMNLKAKQEKQKQTEVAIYNSCKKKYLETEEHLKRLAEKKAKLEDEIVHLQQKQADRKKFLAEVQKRHAKN